MTLYELLKVLSYDQRVGVYQTNDYDENLPLAEGTLSEIMDLHDLGPLFDSLMDEVFSVKALKDRTIQILVRGRNASEPRRTQYDEKYVAGWKDCDPSTRPFLYGCELPGFGE